MSTSRVSAFKGELDRLVAAFEHNFSHYKRRDYDEASVRLEFLDPLFKALGWDVENKARAIPSRREVEIESRTRIEGRQKRADYLFRTDRVERFVCEAKKPAVVLSDAEAFQAKRYAWNKGVPLAILTDFEELKIFVVGSRPRLSEPVVGLYRSWRFTDYPAAAEELWTILSRESVASGSIDRLVAALPRKQTSKGRGNKQWAIRPDRSRSIDGDFLDLLDESRRSLASDLLRNNKGAFAGDDGALNDAVQRILDRLLFLRICEDRGIDTGLTLLEILGKWRRSDTTAAGTLWRRLAEHFRALNSPPPSTAAYFNGNLFKGHFSEDLVVSNGWASAFLDRLGGEESPYLFGVMPVEILGSIYERFLGKVVRPQGRGVTIEEKPEVRKAGGVYYTPRYIVDYIVDRTLSPLLAQMSPEESLKLRVVDPACGSGSFLIAAFERLCEHWQMALQRDKSLQRPGDCWIDSETKELHLTPSLKRRILVANIYGVDIDPGAVEVTQLSLYLKMLENEDRRTIERDRGLFGTNSPLLPSLERNIQCGNSIISTRASMVPAELIQLNAFDWEERFPKIVRSGGFDVVIGNPPYLNIDEVWGSKDIRSTAIKALYPDVYRDKTDILFYFLRRSLDLTRNRLGMIVSRAFLEAYKADKLRGFLADSRSVARIIDFRNFQVFQDAGITTAIIEFQKEPKLLEIEAYRLRPSEVLPTSLKDSLADTAMFQRLSVPCGAIGADAWVFADPGITALYHKIDQRGDPAGNVLAIGKGMETGANEAFGKLTEELTRDWRLPPEMVRLRLTNSDIQRFSYKQRGEVLLYVEDVETFDALPAAVKQHLLSHAGVLRARAAFKRGNCEWWRFTWPLHQGRYASPRIVAPYMASTNRFALVEDTRLIGLTDTIVLFDNGQAESLKYFLGLLNSRLLTFRFRGIGKLKAGGVLEYFWNSVSKLPLRRIDFRRPEETRRHDEVVETVEKLIGLNSRLIEGSLNERETALIEGAILAAERVLDHHVYALYEIGEAEANVIESSFRDV